MRDLVERQKAIEAMSESLKRVFPEHRQIAEKCLNALPSVTPEQEHGKWEEKAVSDEKVIDEWQSARCSACGKYHTAASITLRHICIILTIIISARIVARI